MIAQPLADDLLGFAVPVDVGGVDEIDADLECALHDAHAVVVVRVSVLPEHHCAQAESADRDAGSPECRVLHAAPKPKRPLSIGEYEKIGRESCREREKNREYDLCSE